MLKFLLLLCAIVVIQVEGHDFVVGDVDGDVQLSNRDEIKRHGIPFIKRVKEYSYSQPDERLIEGIRAVDKLEGKATVEIQEGGLGFSYVNLLLTSARHHGLDYEISIFVQDDEYLEP